MLFRSKVTVVIELLARFDEASNINWSKKMQDAGVNVIFGVEGLNQLKVKPPQWVLDFDWLKERTIMVKIGA